MLIILSFFLLEEELEMAKDNKFDVQKLKLCD